MRLCTVCELCGVGVTAPGASSPGAQLGSRVSGDPHGILRFEGGPSAFSTVGFCRRLPRSPHPNGTAAAWTGPLAVTHVPEDV